MLKTIALFVSLLIPTIAMAEVEPLSTPSPNTGTITPTAIKTGATEISSATLTVNGTDAKIIARTDTDTFTIDPYNQTITGTTNWLSKINNAAGNFRKYIDGGVKYYLTENGLSIVGAFASAGNAPAPTAGIAFAVDTATFTVRDTGIVSAPSQPFFRSHPSATISLTQNTDVQMFYQAPAAGNNEGGMYGGAASSGTFTVPANAAGVYQMHVAQYVANAGAWNAIIKVNGTTKKWCATGSGASVSPYVNCLFTSRLAAGDAVTVFINQTGTTVTADADLVYDSFTMVKLW